MSTETSQHPPDEPDRHLASARLRAVTSPSREQDARRFSELMRAHYGGVWRTLRRMGVAEGCADDFAQEAFMVLSRRLGDVRHGSERTFLLGSAVRIAANYRRTCHVRREVADARVLAEERDPRPTAEQLLDRKRLRQALDELINGWPEDVRVAFVLFELEGLSAAEISRVTETKLGTVASRLRRARELFQAGAKRLRSGRKHLMQINAIFVIAGLLSLGCGGRGLVKKVDFTSPEVQKSPEGKACAKDVGLIADGENNSNQIAQIQNRGGYWYTFVDDAGSRVVPEAGKNGGTFQMTPGGANGTQYAARITGSVGGGNPAYVGMGFNFVDPKGSYDASKYQGIRFWAKKGPGSTDTVKLKVPDAATDPDGKLCTECYNDFGRDLTLKNEWTEYVVPFYLMKQEPTWGSPHPANIDSSKIYSVQFQFNQAGQPFDLWVDEVEFTGCPG